MNEHDMQTFQRTASAVAKLNDHCHNDTDYVLRAMLRDAERFMRECALEDECGYMSTMGYVLTTYRMKDDRTMRCYASVASYLFKE